MLGLSSVISRTSLSLTSRQTTKSTWSPSFTQKRALEIILWRLTIFSPSQNSCSNRSTLLQNKKKCSNLISWSLNQRSSRGVRQRLWRRSNRLNKKSNRKDIKISMHFCRRRRLRIQIRAYPSQSQGLRAFTVSMNCKTIRWRSLLSKLRR